MNPGDVVVVVPSNRGVSAARLAAIHEDVDVLVVADGDAPVRCDRPNSRVFDVPFQRRYMGADFDLIPRGTAACRNFGFYYVWRETAHRLIITLDDDVTTSEGFLDAYALLDTTPTLPTATACRWINTVALLDGGPACFARGFPYEDRTAPVFDLAVSTARVVCHMGLWDGILDTDALDKQLFERYRARHEPLTAVRPATRAGARVRFPLSSMNAGVVRDALPAMYQMPMEPSFAGDYALWRYDDIWAGYVLQTLAEIRGEAATAGAPVVRHDKIGDLRRELLGEHYGILMSPWFYDAIDEAAARVRPGPYAGMLAALAEGLTRRKGVPDLYWRYIAAAGGKLRRWAVMCLS
jgi:hypothetical protein